MIVDLQGKVAVITGGAGTIGSATARLLAENGAAVCINDVSAERLESVVNAFAAQGLDVFGVAGDVRREEDMKALIEAAEARHGCVDILVNNAGVNVGNEDRKPAWEYNPDAWRRVLDICIDSVYYCSKYALPGMIRAGGGRIVHIGSVAGWLAPLRLQCAYSAAKAAIINLTRSMAIDYAKHHINVNTVIPGSIPNDQLRSIMYNDPEKHKSMFEHIPLGAPGAGEDIGNAVMFLVSPEARYITGCALNVDGGWAAGYSLDIVKE
jgi:NAD(P)-dependent dehydrogenase (short-subunit alcohol dehydrogenase family)